MIGNSIDIEPIADNHHRWNFISKIPFFNKSKKPPLRRLKLLEIYRFADKFDVLLMIIGIAAAILSGVLFPIMLFFYGKIINNLVDTKKMQIAVNSSSFIINNDTDQCFILPDSNNTQNESPYNIINQTLHYYAILGCLSIVFYWIAWTTWLLAAERQVRRIRYTLFQNILQQEIGWFDVNNIGLLNNRLLTDLNIIKDGIDDKIPDLFSLLTRILGSIIYVFIVGWKLTLLFLCLLPLMLILFKLIIKITVIYANKSIEAFALASSVAQEVFQNIRTVTAFHGQIKEEERFTKHLIRSKNLEIKKNLYLGLCQGLAYFLVFVSYGLTLWYGPKLVRTDCNNYSAGSVMVIFIGCMFSTVNLAYLTPNIQKIFEALTSGSYVFEIIDRKTKIDPLNNDGDKPENFIGEIEFDNVSFSYPSRPEISIFNRISLKIPANKIVALVGHSGCGKSTIIQLIQRLYDSEQGQILIDGKDIKTLNVAWLRSQIGIVSQEPNLFLGSIEDNIRFGKLNATDDEIETAAKIANAHQFIMELPQHYKSESVNKLSGGQKQRVAIARALISNPKILILDEATSALDNISERLIQQELEKNKQGRTTIIIAHRLSTIENADLIIGFDNGQVIEYGTHDQLIQSKGLYYKLITSQNDKEKSSINNEENNQIEELIPRNSIQTEITNENQILDENLQTNFDKYSQLSNIHDSISLVWKTFKLNSPEWSWIVLGGISSLFLGATQPLFAVFLGKIFALFAESDLDEQKRLTNIYSTIIILIGLIGGIASIFISISFAKSSEQLIMRMRKLIFSSILRQEISYFDLETNSPGALITRLSTDASCLKGMTGNNIGIILQTLSATITALVITFAAGWKLTFVALCFVPLIIYSGVLQGRKQNNIDKTINKDSFDEQGGQYATQALENIRTIASLHLENYFLDVYKNSFDQQFKKRSFRLCLPGISAAITNSLVYFLYMAIFSYGSQLVQQEEMSFDQVFRILVGITFTMTTVGRSIAMLSDYSKARQAARRIFQLHQRQSKINPHNQSGLILDTVLGSIQFDNVQFEYPSRSNLSVLNNFSLNCSNSSTTALVGPSGSGKSTIIGLLQRFYDPSQGKIYLDGYDIKHLNLQWLRSLMGFVQQEPVLFNLSIRENIAYGSNDQQVTQDQIEHAAKLAHIHHFIISLPKGYETLCGSKGNQLSGGQKQRIAIARALIRQPKILLLDEATSSLDNHSEELVQQALNEAMVGRTSLTVAHRLSTIQHADKIAFVYQGKIQEEGKHEQLIKLNGFYAQLLFKQEK